ncbi:MAG: NADH:ubiquinone oxidoreductase [Nitrospira bacterium HGW-Nitrospira-1]|nr:MAG: NADH:ubiquinone oxidoreductase [Nitrospira bacterium HGW-Nitrospira-1]
MADLKPVRTYLGMPLYRPKTAFFELSSCEGCQLQLLNNEASLLDFLSLLDIVNFREAMTEKSDEFEIAFIEGSVTRSDEVERLKEIRKTANTLVAFGSCACFGGVNQMKNRLGSEWVKKEVYGDHPVESGFARPLEDIVTVDLKIFGCPIKKKEVEKIIINIALGKAVVHPVYPVCMECKANENICLFDLGEPCLGPITRGGCDSWCPNSRFGCWGCRGPADDANIDQLREIMKKHGFSEETLRDRLECFGGFSKYTEAFRKNPEKKKEGK